MINIIHSFITLILSPLVTISIEVNQNMFVKSEIYTGITISPLSIHITTGEINCAIFCNADTRCKAFTICRHPRIVDSLRCSLYDRNIWKIEELSHDYSCSYYEKGDYCWQTLKRKVEFIDNGNSLQLPRKPKTISCLLPERKPFKGNQLEVIPTLSKSWLVSLDFKPLSCLTQWSNIIHFTNEKHSSLGGRIPAVFFSSSGCVLYIVSSVNNNNNFGYNTGKQLLLNVWYNIIVVQQKDESGKHMYRIFLNHKEVTSVENKNAQEFHDVTVWLSSPWRIPADIEVRDLYYSNLE